MERSNSILVSNDIISSLWSKHAKEKCRIGLADAVLFDDGKPSKHYFTGKAGKFI